MLTKNIPLFLQQMEAIMEHIQAYEPVLAQTGLFRGIAPQCFEALFNCLNARIVPFKKGESILEAGAPAQYIGVVLEGTAQAVRDDIAGNRHILAALEPADVFGESYAASEMGRLPIAVVAMQDGKALLVPYARVTRGCSNACGFHAQLIHNLMSIIAQKNLQLNQKIEHLSKRTTREKVLSYLMEQAQRQGGKYFTVPFNRQELADYLLVDRSALSSELSKLRAEGVLEFYKNEFKLML